MLEFDGFYRVSSGSKFTSDSSCESPDVPTCHNPTSFSGSTPLSKWRREGPENEVVSSQALFKRGWLLRSMADGKVKNLRWKKSEKHRRIRRKELWAKEEKEIKELEERCRDVSWRLFLNCRFMTC